MAAASIRIPARMSMWKPRWRQSQALQWFIQGKVSTMEERSIQTTTLGMLHQQGADPLWAL